MHVIKFYIDDFKQDYRVTGSCLDSNDEVKTVYYASAFYSRAFELFDSLSGFECQRVIIRKV